MPTIFRDGRFRVAIFTNDHPPPHVHVFTTDGEVIIELGDLRVVGVRHMRARDVDGACLIALANEARFLADWERIHGWEEK